MKEEVWGSLIDPDYKIPDDFVIKDREQIHLQGV